MSIIIVGGGMIGATLAIAISYLTSGRLLVHLIEETLPNAANKFKNNNISIVLSHGTCQQLERIGIWKIISCFATPINSIHVSDRGHAGFVILKAQDYWIDALGQVIRLHDVRLCLFNLLQTIPGVILYCPNRVSSFTRSNSIVSVTLDNGKILEGQLLIAANGSCSPFAEKCGIVFHQEVYNQMAVITNITTSINHNGRAWERFTEYGPLAILPVSKKKCSLVWCNTKEKIEEMITWSDDQFCDNLQKFFGWRLGRIICTSNRIAYPLIFASAMNIISHRFVLVGNAAQTLHPVAGQGFNLGVRDVMSLAEILAITHSRREDCGDYSTLSDYRRHCQLDRLTTINITDALIRLFTNHWIPLVIGRNFGMVVLELLSPIRNLLAKQTLGWIER